MNKITLERIVKWVILFFNLSLFCSDVDLMRRWFSYRQRSLRPQAAEAAKSRNHINQFSAQITPTDVHWPAILKLIHCVNVIQYQRSAFLTGMDRQRRTYHCQAKSHVAHQALVLYSDGLLNEDSKLRSLIYRRIWLTSAVHVYVCIKWSPTASDMSRNLVSCVMGVPDRKW